MIHGDDAILVRPATDDDAVAVARIYDHYVERTSVTFEEATVPPSEIARRIRDVQAAALPWLVAARGGEVVGYAYAGPWHSRSAYRFSAEVTVYVDARFPRAGIGAQLYGALLPILEARGVHALLAAIALPNAASVALHERFGFAKVGHFAEIGLKFGRRIDVGYWQRLLG
jgi:L-amino acid N-acyltransferase YncA